MQTAELCVFFLQLFQRKRLDTIVCYHCLFKSKSRYIFLEILAITFNQSMVISYNAMLCSMMTFESVLIFSLFLFSNTTNNLYSQHLRYKCVQMERTYNNYAYTPYCPNKYINYDRLNKKLW